MSTPQIHTKYEIEGQPDLWIETLNFLNENPSFSNFITPILQILNLNIVLTGAGSSAFIGESVEHLFRNSNGAHAKAIPTTSLVTHFRDYIDTKSPLLLISFARSGNSPESIAVVDIAESLCTEVYHVVLSCNPKGNLATKAQDMENAYTLILPSAAEDQGLAMTGSFTAMMLSAIYIAKKENRLNSNNKITKTAEAARTIISKFAKSLKTLSSENFTRIIFLGSGPLLGIARESHLKVQELTDGVVVGKFDSFLGFRHGPKAVIDNKTILVFLFSPNENVFCYEKDLATEILQEDIAMKYIGIFYSKEQSDELPMDINIVTCGDKNSTPVDFDLLPYVIPAQIIGFYKSLDLGLKPDAPSKNNSISRVVKGVKIYEYK